MVLVLAALGIWRFTHRASPPQAQPGKPVALAIMPLKYTGPDDQAYLKDLLPLRLTERLRISADLETAPFSSTRTLGPTEDVKSVAQQLGVAAVIYGELTGKDGRLELLLTMKRPETNGVVWTSSLSGDVSNIIPRTEDAASDIARIFGARWNKDPSARTAKRDPLRADA